MTDFDKIRQKVLDDIFAEFSSSSKHDPIAETAKSINIVAVEAAIRVLREYERAQPEHIS